VKRREFFGFAAAAATLAACDRRPSQGIAPAPSASASAGAWPEKVKDMILLTDRPPNLEMPLRYLRHDLTPNDALYVRWHLATLPTSIDARTFRLRVTGEVERPLALSLDDLRKLEAVSVVAVNQCSGNARALFSPRVPGVQWMGGALGNARWTGVRLRDLLERAGVKGPAANGDARDVTFRGLDKPPLESVPAFVKSLDLAHAMASEGEVIVAYAMNDAPLPMLNGFPLRLVVPGWFSTYWTKALTEVHVLGESEKFQGFWMTKAYRVPKREAADESPTDLAKDTVPITRLNVRSLVVRPEPGESLAAGAPYAMEGIAFDGGSGIRSVEISTDGGATWRETQLDRDLGAYSFRRWRATWTPSAKGDATVIVRATSQGGESQRSAPQWNRSGYMRNALERVEVKVT
jgi:sulfite dehydrogenase